MNEMDYFLKEISKPKDPIHRLIFRGTHPEVGKPTFLVNDRREAALKLLKESNKIARLKIDSEVFYKRNELVAFKELADILGENLVAGDNLLPRTHNDGTPAALPVQYYVGVNKHDLPLWQWQPELVNKGTKKRPDWKPCAKCTMNRPCGTHKSKKRIAFFVKSAHVVPTR